MLLTTRFARNAVVHNGVLDDGVESIGKPRTLKAVAGKLGSIL